MVTNATYPELVTMAFDSVDTSGEIDWLETIQVLMPLMSALGMYGVRLIGKKWTAMSHPLNSNTGMPSLRIQSYY